MRLETWRAIGSVSPSGLVDTTLELHWAVQLVAAGGQAFAEERPDDSHRAMAWSADRQAFVGAPFAGAYPFRLALRPADLTLMLLDGTGQAVASQPLPGTTLHEGRSWLHAALATYLGGGAPTVGLPDYDMPDHPVAAGLPFSTDRSEERSVLARLYAGAAEMLQELVSTRSDASSVTLWPHHLDIATLLTVERAAEGAATKTVGVGMAPMGGGYESWYWYVTPWPYPEPSSLPALSGPGAWHTEGWTGAVLTGETLVLTQESFRDAVLRKFLDVSVEAAAAALRG